MLKPNVPFRDSWHVGAITEHLEAVTRGQIKRLLINVPPRCLKSTLVSVCWPAWTWIRWPEHKWLCGSYALKLAIRDSLAMRRLIQSQWYQERWGRGYNLADSSDWGDPDGFELTDDQNQKMRFENDRTGYRIAFGFEAGVMGEGGDTCIVDDPHDQHRAHSEVELAKDVETFREGISTRLNDPTRSAIVAVAQRLHVADLSAHMISQGYELLLLPMHYDAARARATCLGFRDPRRENGALLHPERFTAEAVAEWEGELLTAASGQLEQNPAPSTGEIFDPSWWRFWDELPDRFDLEAQSWDMAFKGERTSNFVAGQAWGKLGANAYMKDDEVYAQLDFVKSLEAFRAFSLAHPSPAKLVEDKANGPAIIATLRNEIPGILPVNNPEGGALGVARSVAPYVKAGNVRLPNPYRSAADENGVVTERTIVRPERRWVLRMMKNATTFPKGSEPAGSHGDDVVAMTQAINYLLHPGGASSGANAVSFLEWQVERMKNADAR